MKLIKLASAVILSLSLSGIASAQVSSLRGSARTATKVKPKSVGNASGAMKAGALTGTLSAAALKAHMNKGAMKLVDQKIETSSLSSVNQDILREAVVRGLIAKNQANRVVTEFTDKEVNAETTAKFMQLLNAGLDVLRGTTTGSAEELSSVERKKLRSAVNSFVKDDLNKLPAAVAKGCGLEV